MIPETRPMTDAEIVSEYRQAANKQAQIQILADLNLCQPRDIAEILAANGQDLPKIWIGKLAKPRRGSPEDLERRRASLKPGRPPMDAAAKDQASLPAPDPAPAMRNVTAGKLAELLRGLPVDTKVLLTGSGQLQRVVYTRDYDSRQDAFSHVILLEADEEDNL